MHRICLHDKALIESALRRNPYLHLYSLGDLDDFFWPSTTWYGWGDGAVPDEVALVYSAGDTPILLALSHAPEASAAAFVRTLLPLLPRRLYAHLSGELVRVLAADYAVEDHGQHLKLALTDPGKGADVDTTAVEPLTPADLPALTALYAASYPDNAFDPRTLETGLYRGIRQGNELVSVAGIHVYSERYGVAAIGNVVTRPDLRGRGLGTAVCAELCRVLGRTVPHIGLNVKADNTSALRAYRRLGFEPIAEYQEVMLRLRQA